MAFPTFGPPCGGAGRRAGGRPHPSCFDGQPYSAARPDPDHELCRPGDRGSTCCSGYTGLVSLGHMGFAGVGAYCHRAPDGMDHGWPAVPAMAAGAAAAGGLGVLVGIPLP